MKRLINFVFYNNGFVVMLLLVVLSSSSVFAASPKAREGVLSSEEKLVRVDNSYIRDVNLRKQDFDVKVTQVEKDDENYYVSYEFRSIELVDGAWKKVLKKDILVVNIQQLGDRDLGLYVAEELEELVAYTKRFLEEVQIAENKKGATQKTINKTYKGLVGRWLKPNEKTFAGYDPVIEPPVIVAVVPKTVPVPDQVVDIPVETVIDDSGVINNGNGNSSTSSPPVATSTPPVATSTPTTTPPVVPPDTTKPLITLVGQPLLELVVGSTYTERGATANDNLDGDVSGSIVVSGVVNTAVAGSYVVTYSVSDKAGNQSSITREVKVVDPPLQPAPKSTTTSPTTPPNSSSSPSV